MLKLFKTTSPPKLFPSDCINFRYETVYEVSGPQPDFHRIHKFGALDLTQFVHSNARYRNSFKNIIF